MLVQSGLEFMRDAFVACRFAEARKAEKVWLIEDVRPDFCVQLDDARPRFEVTEADWPDRKRSDEYKYKHIPERLAGTEKVEYAPELFSMEADDALEMLNRVAAEKSDGRYDQSDSLVIYLQPGSWTDERPAVEKIMAKATEVAKDHFSEVWVLWSSRLYQTWQGGKASTLPFISAATTFNEDEDDE